MKLIKLFEFLLNKFRLRLGSRYAVKPQPQLLATQLFSTAPEVDLSKKGIRELRVLSRGKIVGFMKLSKGQLIERLSEL